MATKSDVSMSTCIDSYGSAIGMPQLCTDWASNQIFWLVVTLVAIFFVLSRLALPRISAVLSERQGTITNDLAAAENLKSEAEQAEEAYKKALEDARLEASKIIESAKAEIKPAGPPPMTTKRAARSALALDERVPEANVPRRVE